LIPLRDTLNSKIPDGSEELFVPKNHSKLGYGTLKGNGFGVITAEHSSVKFIPAVEVTREPNGSMTTGSMLTENLM
jgi:hypothetical protein